MVFLVGNVPLKFDWALVAAVKPAVGLRAMLILNGFTESYNRFRHRRC
ncbi:hypothetical protein ANO14919_037750 [Xylariales sp. No.14919]|nr:hypothetical protein ANO14919_037750 [Xylariales sp. No.14919]